MRPNTPSFVDGLVALDLAGTRKRLAAALAEARLQAQWAAGPRGDAIAEAIRYVDSVLLEAARWAVQRIDAALVESRAVPARPETQAEAFAAVVAGLDGDAPLRPDVTARNIAASRAEPPPPGC